jgi:L-asparaginase II
MAPAGGDSLGVMEVLAEVERSGFVESRHLGAVAVADVDGRLLAAAGDPELVVYSRSCSKPFQALAVRGLGVERELGLGAVELAGACGSHDGEPEHVASVRKVLAAAGLDEDALRCPPVLPSGREARRHAEGPAAVYHNCSGKHAYMLAGSVVRGWAPERYTAPEHPLQAVVADTLVDFAGVAVEHVGVDGCGVPVHAVPLRGLATAYARLGSKAAAGEDGPAALVAAVRAHPFMLAGSGQLDTLLLEATGGRVLAKVGAEAAYAAVDLAAGGGLALKVLDGAPRARGAALLAVLRALGWIDDRELAAVLPAATVEIHGGGRTVGQVRPADLDLPPLS